MPGQRHRAIVDGTLLAITALFVLGGLIALGFLANVSKENRALIIISSVGIICCLVGLIFISAFRKWFRKWVWRRAMSAWNETSQAGNTPNFDMTRCLGEESLRQLVIQVYSRMGYRLANREKEAEYLQLLDPDRRMELIACEQQPDPMELPRLYRLQLEMKRTKAARAFLWAPAGFTNEARNWVVHRPIILADQYEIGRLVACAEAKGSRFLEYQLDDK